MPLSLNRTIPQSAREFADRHLTTVGFMVSASNQLPTEEHRTEGFHEPGRTL